MANGYNTTHQWTELVFVKSVTETSITMDASVQNAQNAMKLEIRHAIPTVNSFFLLITICYNQDAASFIAT